MLWQSQQICRLASDAAIQSIAPTTAMIIGINQKIIQVFFVCQVIGPEDQPDSAVGQQTGTALPGSDVLMLKKTALLLPIQRAWLGDKIQSALLFSP